jgi:putative nucleotidyltransferase with HDIG domain
VYILFVFAVSTALVFWTVPRSGKPSALDLLFFWLVAGLANLIGRVEVPVAGLSLLEEDKPRGIPLAPGFIVLVTAAFATRPSTAILVGLLSEIPELLKPERRNAAKFVFNSAQQAIYVGASSLAFWALRASVPGAAGGFAAAAAAGLLAVVLNHLLVGGVVALEHRVAIGEIVRRMAWPAPLSVGFGLVALLIAALYSEFGAVSALFLFMPLTALRVVREAKMSLDAAVERAITDFARAVDEKDPYTYRHSDRVAMIAVELHRELGTSRKSLDRRWSAAVLHDVGKVAVPTPILTKPGPLTNGEYETIKRHPGLGADVVETIDLFRSLAAEIRHHHERFDGQGYPDGLVGHDIPFEARVLAVADAFEALTSDRPYRRAMTTDQALAELSRSSGMQHDPEVVAALHRVIANGVKFVRPDSVPQRSEKHLRAVQTA